MLEPLDNELHNTHLLGSKCLIKVNNSQSCLKVLNPTNQKIRLGKGKIVATVSNFDRDACMVYNLDTQPTTNESASIHNFTWFIPTQTNKQLPIHKQTNHLTSHLTSLTQT